MQDFLKVNEGMKFLLKKSTSSDFSHFSEVICRFLLSEKFSQDSLQEHFGAQRRSDGCNENPNLLQFQNQEQRLNVIIVCNGRYESKH